MNSRSLTQGVVICTGMLLLSACGVAVDNSVQPESRAGTYMTARPLNASLAAAESVVSDIPNAGDSELVGSVVNAYHDMTFPADAAEAEFIIVNGEADKFMTQCLADAGFDYPVLAAKFHGTGLTPRATEAAWAAPPNATEAANGLGVTPNPDTIHPGEDLVAPTFASADEEQRYYDRAAECGSKAPEISLIDWSSANDVRGQYFKIGEQAKKTAGFSSLNEQYIRCVSSQGGSFTSPESLLDLVKARAQTDPEGARAFELNVASLDASCREPLFSQFILLQRAEWTKWLASSAESRQKMRAVWDDLVLRAKEY